MKLSRGWPHAHCQDLASQFETQRPKARNELDEQKAPNPGARVPQLCEGGADHGDSKSAGHRDLVLSAGSPRSSGSRGELMLEVRRQYHDLEAIPLDMVSTLLRSVSLAS